MLMLAGLFSCVSNKNDEGIHFTTIGKGDYGMGSTQEIIIKTQDEWETLLTSLPKFDTDRFSETVIDFGKCQIISVFKSCPTGGWNVYVSSIKEYPYRIVVTVKVTAPKGAATDGLTSIYHIIKMPVTAMPIEFSYLHF